MADLNGKRILIVEDNITNMAVFASLLRNSRATILRDFWQGDTSEILLRHLPVDVILMDLMLRGDVSGYTIFDAIKTYSELRHIPVIAVSAADPDTEIPKARARGFAGFIGKPIDARKFTQQIVDCMNGKPVWYAHDSRFSEL